MNKHQPRQTVALGIDIGGSKTAIALVDIGLGQILSRQLIETPPRENTGEGFIRKIAECSRQLCQAASFDLASVNVGIGLCELVETNGRVASAHRVMVREDQVKSAFGEFASIAIDADVRVAALAEARFGSGRGFSHWIYVNAGTGIASVLMRDGECYAGAHGWALGLGVSPVDLAGSGGPLVEDLAGGAGLLRLAHQQGMSDSSVRQLIAKSMAGSPEARRILERGGEVIGSAIAALVNVLDPEAVVVGGGLVSVDSPFWSALVDSCRKHIWHGPAKSVSIERARLLADAGVIGAGIFASDRPEFVRPK